LKEYIDIQERFHRISIITMEPIVKSSSSSSRKKLTAKNDDAEKITEHIEGGIIVRRYKGEKIEPL
jgi:hypothetical protein